MIHLARGDSSGRCESAMEDRKMSRIHYHYHYIYGHLAN